MLVCPVMGPIYSQVLSGSIIPLWPAIERINDMYSNKSHQVKSSAIKIVRAYVSQTTKIAIKSELKSSKAVSNEGSRDNPVYFEEDDGVKGEAASSPSKGKKLVDLTVDEDGGYIASKFDPSLTHDSIIGVNISPFASVEKVSTHIKHIFSFLLYCGI